MRERIQERKRTGRGTDKQTQTGREERGQMREIGEM